MNFPDTPNIGQTWGWGDYVWQYAGNDKWNLLWIRGRGNLITFFLAFIAYNVEGGNLMKSHKFLTFDAT